VAGINAGRQSQGQSPFTLNRDEALTGVLIDDLIKDGAEEPYRMFTARSEYRLTVRAENSDFRLSPKALELGILSREQAEIFRKKQDLKTEAFHFISGFSLSSNKWNKLGVSQASDSKFELITA